jgi:hypothetical protein
VRVTSFGWWLPTTSPASATGTKKKFVAQVQSDSGCPTGISLADEKNASQSRMCVAGYPPAAVSDVRPYLGSTVAVEGVVDGNSFITLKKVAKKKVYDPCALGVTGFMAAFGAGMAGMPPAAAIPPGCGVAVNADATALGTGSSSAPAPPDAGPTVSTSGQPAATAAPGGSSSRFISGVPQCTRTLYESGNLWIVNSCNIAVTVRFTNDNGPFWGLTDVGPNNRSMISGMGLYDPRKNGNVYLFACRKGSSAVMPNGDGSWGTNYKALFTCAQQ